MKMLAILSLILVAGPSCYSQTKSTHQKNENSNTVKTPHGQWTVRKQYDADGNLISKDSTYSYSEARINGKKVPQSKIDSLYRNLKSSVRANFSHMRLPDEIDLDSLESSFFNQKMGDLQTMQQQMKKQMQAMQQQFLNQFNSGQRRIPRENPDSTDQSTPTDQNYKTHEI